MDLKSMVDDALTLVQEIILSLSGGLKWRHVKKMIRQYLWKPYLKPAIKDEDFGWTDDALLLITLIRILVKRFWASPESMRNSALSHETLLKKLADQ